MWGHTRTRTGIFLAVQLAIADADVGAVAALVILARVVAADVGEDLRRRPTSPSRSSMDARVRHRVTQRQPAVGGDLQIVGGVGATRREHWPGEVGDRLTVLDLELDQVKVEALELLPTQCRDQHVVVVDDSVEQVDLGVLDPQALHHPIRLGCVLGVEAFTLSRTANTTGPPCCARECVKRFSTECRSRLGRGG